MAETEALTEASAAFILEHHRYNGCTMASLTIRERLVAIEAAVRASEAARLAAALHLALAAAGVERSQGNRVVDGLAALAPTQAEPEHPAEGE